MKIAILGGAGAMGGAWGAALAENGHEVILVDVNRTAVDRVRSDGLTIEQKSGDQRTVRLGASAEPAEVGPVDLVIVFVKCYHTEGAVRSAEPLLASGTRVLSLQNGWGNGPRIAEIVGEDRTLAGVTYHSATLKGPGHVLHAGVGPTYIGKLDGTLPDAVRELAQALSGEGLEVRADGDVRVEVWKKLLLNICTLPTSALLRFGAGQLVEHEGTLDVMRSLLAEGVAVAHAQGIAVDEEERWEAITGLLGRVGMSKSSMLQDVEAGRQTEISVINGAIVQAGEEKGVATPVNRAMRGLISALEETFQ